MSSTRPTQTGRDWTAMTPAHFDISLLPGKHRKPAAEGLFAVADILPAAAPKRPAAPEMDGQMDLFGEAGTP